VSIPLPPSETLLPPGWPNFYSAPASPRGGPPTSLRQLNTSRGGGVITNDTYFWNARSRVWERLEVSAFVYLCTINIPWLQGSRLHMRFEAELFTNYFYQLTGTVE
jgi:hypothetical protein